MFGKKPSKTDVAIEVASSLLQMQFTLARASLDGVAAAHDQFALGYVFGFHDAVCQYYGISNDSTEGFGVLTISYNQIAPSNAGKILRQCFDLQKNQTFMQGMVAGGKDVFAYLQNKTPPLGLARHLQS